MNNVVDSVDTVRNRYPHCIVWTPIPILTWIFPIIGHMGIATSEGLIRDFAGPYFVNEEKMTFGNPVKFWQLDLNKVEGSSTTYDLSLYSATEEYKNHMHSLCFYNCHTFVALALNNMRYNGKNYWNIISTLIYFTVYSRYVSGWAVLKTWVPCLLLFTLLAGLGFLFLT